MSLPKLFVSIYVTNNQRASISSRISNQFMNQGEPNWETIMGQVTTNDRPGVIYVCGNEKLMKNANDAAVLRSKETAQRWDVHSDLFIS